MDAETRPGEDVPAYAYCVNADRLAVGGGGVMDQHEPHAVMREALFGD